MLFKKLFQVLVVGGAVMGGASGCSSPAYGQQSTEKTADAGESAAAAGTASAKGQDADAGFTPDAGGGVSGW